MIEVDERALRHLKWRCGWYEYLLRQPDRPTRVDWSALPDGERIVVTIQHRAWADSRVGPPTYWHTYDQVTRPAMEVARRLAAEYRVSVAVRYANEAEWKLGAMPKDRGGELPAMLPIEDRFGRYEARVA